MTSVYAPSTVQNMQRRQQEDQQRDLNEAIRREDRRKVEERRKRLDYGMTPPYSHYCAPYEQPVPTLAEKAQASRRLNARNH